jgi:hypothetical protein
MKVFCPASQLFKECDNSLPINSSETGKFPLLNSKLCLKLGEIVSPSNVNIRRSTKLSVMLQQDHSGNPPEKTGYLYDFSVIL